MLHDAEIIHTVAERLKAHVPRQEYRTRPGNDVLKAGTALLHHDAAKVLQGRSCSTVHSGNAPNLRQAAAVCSHKITNREDMEQAAREIVGKDRRCRSGQGWSSGRLRR